MFDIFHIQQMPGFCIISPDIAIFYPPFDTDEPLKIDKAGDHSERRVLEALSDLDDSWRIFRDLQWRDLEGKKIGRSGEIDLIIFHPELGILIIEVKGGGVRAENGEWFYVSMFDGSEKKMDMSPFEQARRNHYYPYNKLKGSAIGHDFLKSTAFTHTVWFPVITWNADIPVEVPHGGFILDSRHLQNPSKHLRKILSQAAPKSVSWNSKQIDSLIRVLAPEVNLMPPFGAVLGTIKDRLFKMTEGQISVLRSLRKQKRLIIEGCAGSGKTLLAVRLAHEHLNEGKRVLFTCFNKNLAEYVASEFQGYERIDAVNFHELVRRLCDKHSIPYNPTEEEDKRRHFFDVESADLLEKASQFVAPKYDTIIVDEALDFKETWWIALESLAVKEFSYYIFYDRNQNLYNENEKWAPPFDAEPIVLDTNVRNTKPIGDFALKVGNIHDETEYAVTEGPKPEVKHYSDVNEIPSLLKRLVDDLLGKQKVSPDEIVLLSPYRYDSKRLGIKQMVDEHQNFFTTDMVKKGQGKIRIGTIQAFKGLEADVVVLFGIDGSIHACRPANLYVGATRARAMLWVVMGKDR